MLSTGNLVPLDKFKIENWISHHICSLNIGWLSNPYNYHLVDEKLVANYLLASQKKSKNWPYEKKTTKILVNLTLLELQFDCNYFSVAASQKQTQFTNIEIKSIVLLPIS